MTDPICQKCGGKGRIKTTGLGDPVQRPCPSYATETVKEPDHHADICAYSDNCSCPSSRKGCEKGVDCPEKHILIHWMEKHAGFTPVYENGVCVGFNLATAPTTEGEKGKLAEWREIGKLWGYWEYFEKEIRKEMLGKAIGVVEVAQPKMPPEVAKLILDRLREIKP